MKSALFFLLISISIIKTSFAQDTIIQIKISTKLRTNGDGVYELTNYAPKKGSLIKFSGYKTGFWKIIENDSIMGWIPTSCIYTPYLIEQIIFKDKKIIMKKKYGEGDGHDIASGRVWIGMTKDMLIDSRGYPKKINTRKGKGYKSEQWVYGYQYIYLRDNLVDAIHN